VRAQRGITCVENKLTSKGAHPRPEQGGGNSGADSWWISRATTRAVLTELWGMCRPQNSLPGTGLATSQAGQQKPEISLLN
jgi:hypothetical protein